MKKLLIFLGFFALVQIAAAQPDSWKIKHNGKTVVFATHESPKRHVYKLKPADLDKMDILDIMIKEENVQADWQRVVVIVDEKENELFRQEGNEMQIPNSVLKKILAGKDRVFLYTFSLPRDPEKAAVIRIARVHLGTIERKT